MVALSYQRKDYTCGLHSFLNAVSILGIEMSYDEAYSLIGTNSREGTSQRGIMRGLREIGLTATEYRTTNGMNACRWLWKWSAVTPIIVLLDGFLTVGNSHWSTVTGRVGDKVVLIDPTVFWKRGENGAFVLSKDEMLERWKYRLCYAIRVSR